jgi:hypothetical protein
MLIHRAEGIRAGLHLSIAFVEVQVSSDFRARKYLKITWPLGFEPYNSLPCLKTYNLIPQILYTVYLTE